MAKLQAGVIGVGNMGRGVATNLSCGGIQTSIWDIRPEALRLFEDNNEIEVLKPAEMAKKCSVIFFVVPASPQIDSLLKGKDGILVNARKNLILYDFTTSDPAYTRKLSLRSAKRGVTYLDAGMSGGATGADAGKLTLMVGGDKAAFQRTRKYLSPIAENIFYLGESGTGHTLKVIHNMVCHTIFLSTCEGGRMAERAGIKLEDMIAVFNVANARSYASQFRFPQHILSKKWNARSRVFNLHKDLKMANEIGKKLKVNVSLGKGALEFLKKAIDLGMQDKDYSLLYRDFDKIR